MARLLVYENIEISNVANQYLLEDGTIFLYIDEAPVLNVRNKAEIFQAPEDLNKLEAGTVVYFLKCFSGYGQRCEISRLDFEKPARNTQGELECPFTARATVHEWSYTAENNPFAAVTGMVLPLEYDNMTNAEQMQLLTSSLETYAFQASQVLPCLTRTAQGKEMANYKKLNPYFSPSWTYVKHQMNIIDKKLIWNPASKKWTIKSASSELTKLTPAPLPSVSEIQPPQDDMIFFDGIFWGKTTQETLTRKSNGDIVLFGQWCTSEQYKFLQQYLGTLEDIPRETNPQNAYTRLESALRELDAKNQAWPELMQAFEREAAKVGYGRASVDKMLADFKEKCDQLAAMERAKKDAERAKKDAARRKLLRETFDVLVQSEIETLKRSLKKEWQDYCDASRTALQQDAAKILTDLYGETRFAEDEALAGFATLLIDKVVKRQSFLYQNSSITAKAIYSNCENNMLKILNASFPLAAVGSIVTVKTTQGTVTGGLNGIGDDGIRINRRMIWKKQILREEYWRFWKEDQTRHMKELLANSDYYKPMFWKQLFTALLNGGYLPSFEIVQRQDAKNTAVLFNLANWETQPSWFESFVEERLENFILDFMRKHGYQTDQEGWVPTQQHAKELVQKAMENVRQNE